MTKVPDEAHTPDDGLKDPGGPVFPRSRWEPSAVDRLAALEDPELAKRIEAWDEAHPVYEFTTFDMVAGSATPGCVPQVQPDA